VLGNEIVFFDSKSTQFSLECLLQRFMILSYCNARHYKFQLSHFTSENIKVKGVTENPLQFKLLVMIQTAK
jgi:hypothetical protein